MGLNQSIIVKFKDSFKNHCFQLISNAYHSAINEKIVQLNWDENDITSELNKHIETNPFRLEKRIVSNVEHHLPSEKVPKEKGFAAKFPRIDLRLTTFKSTLEFKYFFEAKNLKETDSKLKRRYIDTGIDSFCSGKYSDGSLLAYVLEGDSKNTINGINSLLNKDKRPLEVLVSKANIYHSDYYESSHEKINVLEHIIFDFTKIHVVN